MSSAQDDTSLTERERDVLSQFREITSYNEVDEYAKVKRLLTVCNWNLETAIARYFDNDFPQLFDEIAAVSGTPSRTSTTTHGTLQEGYDAIFERSSMPTPPSFTAGLDLPDTTFPINTVTTGASMGFGVGLDRAIREELLIPKLQRAMPISNRWKFRAGLAPHDADRSVNVMGKLFTPLIFVLMFIPKLLLLVGYALNKVMGNCAPGLFRILGLREEEDDFPAAPTCNVEDSFQFRDWMNVVAGEEAMKKVPIFEGEFNAAFEEAKSQLKWLCIVLINSKSSSGERVVNELIVSDEFVQLVKEHDIVLYVGDVSNPEAFEVGTTYNAYGLPYLALIANVSMTGYSHPEFSVICKYNRLNTHLKEGSKAPAGKVCKRLNRILAKYEPQLVSQRYDKQEVDFARVLREQQDNAYQESLLRDKERHETKRRQQEEEDSKLAEELRLKEEVKANTIKQKERIIKYINANYIRDIEGLQPCDYTKIQFRTQDGKRFIRAFTKDDTVNDVFMFVSAKQLIDEVIKNQCLYEIDNDNADDSEDEEVFELKIEEDVLDYFEHYQFRYKYEDNEVATAESKFPFDLVSPMPRLKLTPGTLALNQVKELWPNGSLLIEHVVDDEDEDEEEEEEGEEEGDDQDEDSKSFKIDK